MTNKLLVGSLPYDLTDAQLQAHFAQVGTVLSAKIIIDRDTGKGKGFGFVEMASEDEAQKAIQELHDSELSGRKILVNKARPQEKRENKGFTKRDYRSDNKNYQSKRKDW